MRVKSLSTRLMLLSSVWALVALVVAAVVLSTLFRQRLEQNFSDLLTAHLYNLIGSVDYSKGLLSGNPNLGDPRFQSPFSGWYWSVSAERSANGNVLRSASMAGESISGPELTQLPFDDEFRRSFRTIGLQNEQVHVIEALVFVGDGNDLFRFRIAGNLEELEQQISDLTRLISLVLLLFGLGTVLSTFLVIKLGLKPLTNARVALNDVRDGRRDQLDGDFPAEIEPLIQEMNALIAANKSVVERARTRVGNLAHALKTPLAVILNETRTGPGERNKRVGDQAVLMQEHVRKYLDQARIAAQVETVVARTDVVETLHKLVRVMRKLNPDTDVNLQVPDNQRVIFNGEQQDFDETFGNLVDNACRFASREVRVAVNGVHGIGTELTRGIVVSVEDDGPGLSDDQISIALKRGGRLDESKPGSGLGLSIARDIVQEYGGTLDLGRSELGGLKVDVRLPGSVK